MMPTLFLSLSRLEATSSSKREDYRNTRPKPATAATTRFKPTSYTQASLFHHSHAAIGLIRLDWLPSHFDFFPGSRSHPHFNDFVIYVDPINRFHSLQRP